MSQLRSAMTTSMTSLPKFSYPDRATFINLFESPLSNYLFMIEADNQHLDNQGLAMDDQEYTGSSSKISLDSLYIFPAASRERIDPDEMVKLNKKEEKERLERLPLIIQDNPRVTLLGDPGIGKSTFIQWLALAFSNRRNETARTWFGNLLPVVITARKLPKPDKDAEINGDTFLNTLLKHTGYGGYLLEQVQSDFEQLLENGQVILLVDGVDEISSETSQWLAKQLKAFLAKYNKVRLLLTARVVGFDSHSFWFERDKKELDALTKSDLDESVEQLESIAQSIESELETEALLASQNTQSEQSEITDTLLKRKAFQHENIQPYPHYYLAPFDIERRNRYVEHWTKLYLPKKTESSVFADTLTGTCQSTSYLDSLSRNPVLLTMICFIQWRVGQLPNGRAELYQRIIATYLVALDRARKTEVAYTPDNAAYDFDDIKLWLGKLAWQMQCGKLTSQDVDSADDDPQAFEDSSKYRINLQGSRLTYAYQSELCRFFASQLSHVICNSHDIDQAKGELPQKAVKEAEKLIDFLKKRTGFLIPKGQKKNENSNKHEEFFSFSHLSFQEYFAGYYLSDNWQEWKSDDDLFGSLARSLDDNMWMEVWQLAFEESNRKQQADMMRLLFQSSSDQELHGGSRKKELLAKIVMNPTIKLKLINREQHISSLWKALTHLSYSHFPQNDQAYKQTLDTLWKESFGAINTLISIKPEHLDLTDNYSNKKHEIVDNLNSLKKLNISRNTLHQLPSFPKLKQLNQLIAYGCSISDIQHLTQLAKLERLNLTGNPIQDFSPLDKLIHLEELFLMACNLTRLTCIDHLTKLRLLNLSQNNIADLSPLAPLNSLKGLYLENNSIQDIGPLQTLINLESLDLDNNRITDLGPLEGLTNLEALYLDNNHIDNLAPLANKPNLRGLTIAHNPITDLTPLASCDNLDMLFVDKQQKDTLDFSMLSKKRVHISVI